MICSLMCFECKQCTRVEGTRAVVHVFSVCNTTAIQVLVMSVRPRNRRIDNTRLLPCRATYLHNAYLRAAGRRSRSGRGRGRFRQTREKRIYTTYIIFYYYNVIFIYLSIVEIVYDYKQLTLYTPPQAKAYTGVKTFSLPLNYIYCFYFVFVIKCKAKNSTVKNYIASL